MKITGIIPKKNKKETVGKKPKTAQSLTNKTEIPKTEEKPQPDTTKAVKDFLEAEKKPTFSASYRSSGHTDSAQR